jgi:hypothetical protein
MAIMGLTIVRSCQLEDVSEQLDDMRHDLQVIAGQLNERPSGNFDVLAKREASHVTLQFKPRDMDRFSDNVRRAAEKIGYFVPKRHDLGREFVLCSAKSRYRSLRLSRDQTGEVMVGIFAAHPPLIGTSFCWDQ